MANLPPATISPAEWEIMKVLWDHGPLAARDVIARLPADSTWAPKTVKTLLSRLVAKDALAFDQIGNSYLYRTVVARDAMTRLEARTMLERLASQASSPILATFIDEADLSDAEIEQLKQQLDQKRSSQTFGKRKKS